MEYLIVALIIIVIILGLLLLLTLRRIGSRDEIKKEFDSGLSELRRDLTNTTGSAIRSMFDMTIKSNRQSSENQDRRLAELSARFSSFSIENEQKLENIRRTMEHNLSSMQEENNRKLDAMRSVVDEKLQKTLDDKLTQSFSLVSQRLEEVYKGLGEMQTLAAGVGDLKKVLSNVKSRGILGEIQLGAILEEILAPEQYDVNVVTFKGSGKPVEFAVKLPGSDSGCVYLPIDSKFPAETYSNLVDAYDSADTLKIEYAGKALISSIKAFAKDIRTKYINPPETTEFGIMFLPFEGLYAEAVRRGLVETLQREYKITLAGPTTMAALLNSLQMGFRTLAIQKRSSEVWDVLGAVKTEFDKFAATLESTKNLIDKANSGLNDLIGVRTRQIQRKLKSVTELSDEENDFIIESLDTEI